MGSARDIRVALEAQGKIAKQTRPDMRSSALRALNAHNAQRWLLTFRHGFGDHVQFSGALAELRRMFPEKQIEVAVCDGHESLISHVADRCHSLNSIPSASRFDLVHVVGWERLKHPVKDAPAIRASQLFLDLGLPIEGKTFAYDCPVSDDQKQRAAKWLLSQKVERFDRRFRAMLIHYRGKSLKPSKDLQHADLSDVMQWARSQGFQPIVIDRDGDNPWVQADAAIAFPDEPISFLAGVASLCHACIGIDSGPGHLFGAVSDRAVVCWRSHHPANYYAPMGNVLHLIPENHESFIHHKDSLPYFEKHYRSATYREPGPAIVEAIKRDHEPQQLAKRSIDSITLNVPQGLGDIIWVYRKFSKYFKYIDLRILMIHGSLIEKRSIEWAKLLPKVRDVTCLIVSQDEYSRRINQFKTVSRTIDAWKTTGEPQDYSCNALLDAGCKLEDICTGKVDWDVEFAIPKSACFLHSDYIAVGVSGSTGKVHNTWPIQEWKRLIDAFYEKHAIGNPLILLGAEFDREAVEKLQALLDLDGYLVDCRIGETPAAAIRVIENSSYFIGYQSGLNVVADMYSVPQTIVYFDCLRAMSDAWVNPNNRDNFHWGCFSDGPDKIVAGMPKPAGRSRKWPCMSRASATIGTWGLGDFLAIYGFMSDRERSQIRTIYWASRNREIIEPVARRCFPNYTTAIDVKLEFGEQDSDTFCATNRADVERRARIEITEPIIELDIQTVVSDVRKEARRWRGVGVFGNSFASIEHLNLPPNYWVLHPYSENARKSFRDLSPDEWCGAIKYLKRHKRPIVVVNRGEQRPNMDGVIDLTSQLPLEHSLEVVRQASGFIGCASSLSVLASKCIPLDRMYVKGHWELRHNHWQVYYAPLENPSFLYPDLRFLATRSDPDPILASLVFTSDGNPFGEPHEMLEVAKWPGVAYQPHAYEGMLYAGEYWREYMRREGTEIGVNINRARSSLVEQHAKTVLDVGIGAGSFIKTCLAARYGYDINPIAARWLKRRQRWWEWEKDGFPDDCDGVCFWDVLEHVAQPSLWLARIPSGKLAFVTIPIVDSIIKTRESKHYKPNEHLVYFTSDGFMWFASQCGMIVVDYSDGEIRAGRKNVATWVLRKK